MKNKQACWLVFFFLLVLPGKMAVATIQWEVDGAAAWIEPSEYNQDFYNDSQGLIDTSPSSLNTSPRYDNRIWDLSLSGSWLLTNDFALKGTLAYLQETTETTLRIDDLDCLVSTVRLPLAYAGLGVEYAFRLNSSWSLFAGAEGGVLVPLGLEYAFETVDSAAARDKLNRLGIHSPERSNTGGMNSGKGSFGARIKLGLR